MALALITGSNGFIGSHLAEYLLSRGWQVRCMVRKTSNLQWLESLQVEYAYADLSDIQALRKAVEGVDYIVHLGGKTKCTTRKAFFEANETGTRNLLQAAQEICTSLKRFVYISSQAASGPSEGLRPRKESDEPAPVTWYGESKLAGEKAVLEFENRMPVTLIRPPSVYGPRDTDVFEIFKAVKWHIKPVLGFQDRYASFLYVSDLTRGIYTAAVSDKAVGEIFFLASDSVLTWQQVNHTIASAMRVRAVNVHLPVFVFGIIALLRELHMRITGKPSILNWQKMNEFTQRYWICDAGKAERMLGFRPEYPIKKGVVKTLQWYRDHNWL